MPLPRNRIVSLSDTPYYHCMSRCVRRAFLCGKDNVSGNNYEHRREWIESALLRLGQIFSIDVCAYAVMSNHTHIVLHVDKERALSWSLDEVISRWHQLFKGTLLTQRYANNETRKTLSKAEFYTIEQTAQVYRSRLYDISWFMRILNEGIARQANEEDNCTGRFWEGRFKSQALLDEAALAACMAYVDLNPVRAKMTKTAKLSPNTSIKLRNEALLKHKSQPLALMPLIIDTESTQRKRLPFHLSDYISLVEMTGKCHQNGQQRHIPPIISSILTQLQVTDKNWLTITRRIATKSKWSLHNAA